jgi:hypothetical protein
MNKIIKFNFFFFTVILQCTSLQPDMNGNHLSWNTEVSHADILSSQDIEYTDIDGKIQKVEEIFNKTFDKLPDWICEIIVEDDKDESRTSK